MGRIWRQGLPQGPTGQGAARELLLDCTCLWHQEELRTSHVLPAKRRNGFPSNTGWDKRHVTISSTRMNTFRVFSYPHWQMASLQVSEWVKVTQSCPTLCDPMDYTVFRTLQARILDWATSPFSRGSSQPRDWTQVSYVAGGFFTSWAAGKPKNTGVGSLSLLQRIFPTQESNQGLLNCRRILYQLSYQGRSLQVIRKLVKSIRKRDFPGHPEVKNVPCHVGDAGLIPSQGTKISHTEEQPTCMLQVLEPMSYS